MTLDKEIQLTAKNKKNIITLGVLLVLGIFLVTYSSLATNEDITISTDLISQTTTENYYSEEEYLENKIATTLNKIEGVDNVTVTLTYSTSANMTYAYNQETSTSKTYEQSDGVTTKETEESSVINEIVLDGNSNPIVVVSETATVEGALIVGEGLDNIVIALTVSRAVQSLLNLPSNKIVVCGTE